MVMYALEEVVGAFESWRAMRSNRREMIPGRLWSMVKTLVPHYKRTHIQRALRISGQHFNEHCLDHSINAATETTDGFVSMSISDVVSDKHEESYELVLRGVSKSLHVRVSPKQLPLVLPHIAGYL